MDTRHQRPTTPVEQRPLSPDSTATANLDSVFDSGYSTGIASFNSSNFVSDSCIHRHLQHRDDNDTRSKTRPEVGMDSGLCIDITTESESSANDATCEKTAGLRLTRASYLPDEDGDTILHLAIVRGIPHLISSIICQSPHPDLLDTSDVLGQSPLHLSAATGQSRVVRQLLVSGATVDRRNEFGNTALHIACENGDLEVTKSILKPISPSEVVDAQLEHYKPQIHGCDLQEVVHQMNYAGQTCVHLAASSGNRKLLEYLKVLGANFNIRDGTRGWTPLHSAIANVRLEVVQSLIRDCKVDLNVRCYSGYTPLKLAWNMTRTSPKNQSVTKIMLLLFESGAKPLDQSMYSDDEGSDFSSSEDED